MYVPFSLRLHERATVYGLCMSLSVWDYMRGPQSMVYVCPFQFETTWEGRSLWSMEVPFSLRLHKRAAVYGLWKSISIWDYMRGLQSMLTVIIIPVLMRPWNCEKYSLRFPALYCIAKYNLHGCFLISSNAMMFLVCRIKCLFDPFFNWSVIPTAIL